MLVITRKKDEKIIIGGNIEIMILNVGQSRVRIGIKAPKEIPIECRYKPSGPASRDNVRSIPLRRAAESEEALPAAASGLYARQPR